MSGGLAFDRLTLALRGRTILRDVSGAIPRGAITAILGPNGAGKSTLLACLAALRTPDEGQVTLEGQPLVRLAARERALRIGLLPQGGAIHWNVSVQALVALGRHPHSGGWRLGAEDQAAIEAALAATDTAHLADRAVHRLSGGEQARVLLARVLAGQPDYILADEPLASLDPAHRLETGRVLRAAACAGAGVAIVLHDLTEAARLADHAVLLREGSVIRAGAACEVLQTEPLAAAYGVRFEIAHASNGQQIILPLER